jgi:tetratricopeptide (TPR) repeat protein
MLRRITLLCLLVSASAWGREGSAWMEVRSAHFTVVTDAGEQQGKDVAGQLEHMRWALQKLFPDAKGNPSVPIVVIAVKNQKDMKALEPKVYLGRGQATLAGLFQKGEDTNYILIRLDVEGEHPYTTVYHEYTHVMLGSEEMPLWLNEGLAEFFQNTEFRDTVVLLGEPSRDDLAYLLTHGLIPLRTLLTVDATSPYYHEEQKGTMFYAESWALTHYLEVKDIDGHTNHIGEYLRMIKQQQDPVTSAENAFGDLKQLEDELSKYIRADKFASFQFSSAAAIVDKSSFAVRPLAAAEADTVRANFLARGDRPEDAEALVDAVLKADPDNEQAHETKGFLEMRAGNTAEAKKWYEEAVGLNPKSYLAHYYYAKLSLDEGAKGNDVESNLRATISLNAGFAPAYDGLAKLYANRNEKLDEARMMEVSAVQLDPGNLRYRLDMATILSRQAQYKDSLGVLKAAEGLARTPLEVDVVKRMRDQVQQRQAQANAGKN